MPVPQPEAKQSGRKPTTSTNSKSIPQAEAVGANSDTDDDNMTLATRTDDDLLDDAVQHALDALEAEDDDEDYEEIVWNLT